jgi:general secretion pathway protein D
MAQMNAQTNAAAQLQAVPPVVTPPPPQQQAVTPQTATAGAAFTLTPPATPVANGASFQIPVTLSGAANIASVPIQFTYDPSRLSLVNVSAGDLLNRDGQAVALIHRDDGPGNVTVVAARPPGATGITGSGVICVLTFQAKAPGPTALTMTRASTLNPSQQPVPVTPGNLNLVVR